MHLIPLAVAIVGWLAVLATARDVVGLSASTFEGFVTNTPVSLIHYSVPWCERCQAFDFETEIAGTRLRDTGVRIGAINCFEEEELCRAHGVEKYPTIRVFRKSADNWVNYPGHRKADGIVAYMERKIIPTIASVDVSNIDAFTQTEYVSVLGFFDEPTAYSIFLAVADTLSDKFLFGVSSDHKFAQRMGIRDMPAIAIFKKGHRPETVVYSRETAGDKFYFDYDSLVDILFAENIPLIGDLSPGLAIDYMAVKSPLLWVLFDSDSDKQQLLGVLKPLSGKFEGKLNVVFADLTLYRTPILDPYLNDRDQLPAVIIQDQANGNLKYVFPETKEMSEEALGEFIDEYLDKTLVPTILSEDIPRRQNDEVVTKVVGRTFHSIVLDDRKDVLLAFNIPWSTYFKSLEPTWERLGQLVRSQAELRDKLVIATINGQLNDVPDDSRYTSAIKLYPAGKKNNPITYHGSRDLESLAAFLDDNATYRTDLIAVKRKKDAKALSSNTQ